MKETIAQLAHEQARLQAEKRMREKLGIPDSSVYCLTLNPEYLIPTPFIPPEPRIKVSPYAKFDKYHHKKKKK